jgi:hypothetical protein
MTLLDCVFKVSEMAFYIAVIIYIIGRWKR